MNRTPIFLRIPVNDGLASNSLNYKRNPKNTSSFTFTILSMEDARIGMVKLTLAEDFDNNAT